MPSIDEKSAPSSELYLIVSTGIAYFISAKIGWYLSAPPDHVSVLWPPNAIMIAALLLTDPRRWWRWLLAMSVAYLSSAYLNNNPLPRTLIFYSANLLEVLIAAGSLTLLLEDKINFKRLNHTIAFIIFAVLFAPFISAFISSTITVYQTDLVFKEVWQVWFLGDALGILVITPLIICAIPNGLLKIKALTRARRLEFALLLLSVGVTYFFVINNDISSTYAVTLLIYSSMPFLLWAAIRFGPGGVFSIAFFISLKAIFFAIHGFGPFSDFPGIENITYIQISMFADSVPFILIASTLEELKKTESLSEQQRSYYLNLMNNLNFPAFVIDQNHRVVIWNKACETLTGLSADEMEGTDQHWRGFYKHYRPCLADIVLKKDLDAVETLYEKYFTHAFHPQGKRSQNWCDIPKGERLFLDIDASPILDDTGNIVAVIEVLKDITVQKQAEEKLGIASRAIEASSSSVIVTDINGTIEHVNPAFINTTGYAFEEILGESVTILKAETENEQRYDELWRAVIKGKPWNGEISNRKKDGTTYIARCAISPVTDDTDKITHVISIQEDITHEHKLTEQINYHARHDMLTGLFNRYSFEEKTDRLLHKVKHSDRNHAFCYLDLDQFKVINDTCGHSAGDELLKQLCQLLNSKIRKSDTFSRLGGDEFGLLMEDCSIEQAHRVANELLEVVQAYQFAWEDHIFRVGVSIGLVEINNTIRDVSELLGRADAACYMAKQQGRNRIHFYHNDDAEIANHHTEMRWVNRIQHALEEDRFCLYAQPIISLKENKPPSHYEILIRMIDEEGKAIPPGGFLPAAERYKLSTHIDRWVVKSVFEFISENPDFMQTTSFLAVNLSGYSLIDEPFLEYILRISNEYQINHRQICFEITETAIISHLAKANVFVNRLRELGCRFALDDFGSGVSSYGYLKNLKVDFLKIDGMFVKGIATDDIDYAMVKSINEIGKVIGMQTIAEFVENDAIRSCLKKIGVDYAQGYGIEKPMPIKEVKLQRLQQAV